LKQKKHPPIITDPKEANEERKKAHPAYRPPNDIMEPEENVAQVLVRLDK
jgi:hypothetical protein